MKFASQMLLIISIEDALRLKKFSQIETKKKNPARHVNKLGIEIIFKRNGGKEGKRQRKY
ncbi:CLUMA_CG004604, isoform A [Clunio marinus]|uniref:CLUMA_CG004604, isoform A n=1 Tax=Clunio marinus TaxID=568069 RepID=A0A1J1HSF4_9DIPT|nr:CLUMA_CG004604, isoform A [Clunio marinus]